MGSTNGRSRGETHHQPAEIREAKENRGASSEPDEVLLLLEFPAVFLANELFNLV